MEKPQSTEGPEKKTKEFRLFAAKRIVLWTVGVLALLWLGSYVLNMFESHEAPSAPKIAAEHAPPDDGHGQNAATGHSPQTTAPHAAEAGHGDPPKNTESHDTADASHPAANAEAAAKGQNDHQAGAAAHQTAEAPHASMAGGHNTTPAGDTHAPAAGDHAAAPAPDTHAPATGGHDTAAVEDDHAPAGHDAAPEDAHADTGHGAVPVSDVIGVTFVMATIAPLQYELEERFYGWRPNDIIRPADNVKNYQLGVLEVTRRTVEALTERISRTGSTQAFDKDLERARNNLMINADDYMLPSAESSYEEALAALARFKAKLESGTAPFYSRTVNLIPLLVAYENLLGSCDDNLVKMKEDDGRDVSWFRADDYFFYAQGVASAMQTILQAVAVDFANVIESRRGDEVLHHALEALHHATAIEPLIILDGDPDGFTANHRANLAAPISHARFYVGLLIQTLST
jgi:hypothetical protein